MAQSGWPNRDLPPQPLADAARSSDAVGAEGRFLNQAALVSPGAPPSEAFGSPKHVILQPQEGIAVGGNSLDQGLGDEGLSAKQSAA